MKFGLFPWYQEIHLAHSSYKVFRSKIFNNLYIQVSSKNSIFFRAMRTDIGYLLSFLFRRKMDVPEWGNEYVGLVKNDEVLYFELEDNEPKRVWRKKENQWQSSDFLGYQLISTYTIEELSSKYGLIEKALKEHWDSIFKDPSKIHGDLTHFNILYSENRELHFIDNKSNAHSKLFDFYYFYSYLRQCLSRCATLSDKDETTIVKKIGAIIKNVCQYSSESELSEDFMNFNFPEISGVTNKDRFQKDFIDIFEFKLNK